MRRTLASLVVLSLATTSASPLWSQTGSNPGADAAAVRRAASRTQPQKPEPPLNNRERAMQMLSRFTFGPRPDLLRSGENVSKVEMANLPIVEHEVGQRLVVFAGPHPVTEPRRNIAARFKLPALRRNRITKPFSVQIN